MNKKVFVRVDKSLPKMGSRLDLHIVLVDHLLKTKKEYKNIRKQEIQEVFIKTN